MRIVVFLGLMLVLLGSPSSALDARTAAKWHSQLKTSTKELRAGRYERALPRVERLIADMVDRLGPGDQEADLFSYVIALRAIAYEGVGNREKALWYWDVAQGIDPKIGTADLSSYGAPGEFLKSRRRLSPRFSTAGGNGAASEANGETEPEEDLRLMQDATLPKVIKQPVPTYTRGAMAFRVEGPVVIRVVIDEEGDLHEPRVVKPLLAPTLSYTVLEAVKLWVFEPAKVAGEPIPIVYNLTANFEWR